MKEKVLLGLTGIIAIVGLVLMFSSSQGTTGEFFFEVDGLGQGASCEDITDVLAEKTVAFQKQANLNPKYTELTKASERFRNVEKTYKDYSSGIKRFEYFGKRECMVFFEFAQVAGLRNVQPLNGIELCCKR